MHASGGRWAGVAILARAGGAAQDDLSPTDPPQASLPTGQPRAPLLTDPRYGLPDDPVPEEARWIEAAADGLRLASVYVPNGRSLDSPRSPRSSRSSRRWRPAAELSAPGPLIDLPATSTSPRADADVYDPAAFVGGTHVTAPERTRLSAILDAGIVDAYRELHPDGPQFTWWDYRAGHFHKGLGLRIDYR